MSSELSVVPLGPLLRAFDLFVRKMVQAMLQGHVPESLATGPLELTYRPNAKGQMRVSCFPDKLDIGQKNPP